MRLPASLRRVLFYILTRRVLRRAALDERALTDYVAAVLLAFPTSANCARRDARYDGQVESHLAQLHLHLRSHHAGRPLPARTGVPFARPHGQLRALSQRDVRRTRPLSCPAPRRARLAFTKRSAIGLPQHGGPSAGPADATPGHLQAARGNSAASASPSTTSLTRFCTPRNAPGSHSPLMTLCGKSRRCWSAPTRPFRSTWNRASSRRPLRRAESIGRGKRGAPRSGGRTFLRQAGIRLRRHFLFAPGHRRTRGERPRRTSTSATSRR